MTIARTLTLLGALAIGAVATVPETSNSVGPNVVLTSAGSRIDIVNSREGQPVVTGKNLFPGQYVRREVRIRNLGESAVRLALSARNVTGVAGPYGGELGDVLRVRVWRARGQGPQPRPVYLGPLNGLRRIELGALTPRRSQHYVFVVVFPDGGVPGSVTGGDNAYQGSWSTARFVWTARPL